MRILHNQSGMTIMDLITGMVVGSIVITGAFQMQGAFVKNNVAVKSESILYEQLARANQILEKDIRMAGYNLPGNGMIPDLSVANENVLKIFINENNLHTTLADDASSGAVKIKITSDAGVSVGQWICLSDGDDDIAYYEISHVGHNELGTDTVTITTSLDDTWGAAGTQVYFADAYTYSLELDGATMALVRRTYNRAYAISSDIDAINVIPKDSEGTPLTNDFDDARSISVQLSKTIPSITGQKTILNTAEVFIRNFS